MTQRLREAVACYDAAYRCAQAERQRIESEEAAAKQKPDGLAQTEIERLRATQG